MIDPLSEQRISAVASTIDVGQEEFAGKPLVATAGETTLSKLVRVTGEELKDLHPLLLLARALLWPLPIFVGGRVRSLALRAIGFQIGPRTILAGMPILIGGKDIYRNLVIHEDCWFNIGCVFDLGARVTIGSRVSIGHEVLLVTSTHQIGTSHHRASVLQRSPITIHDGAWLGARCTIMPGVTVGAGAIVAAGSMVNKDVPANSMVAGVPAQVVKMLV
jgi:maltose O-acetyltransferase